MKSTLSLSFVLAIVLSLVAPAAISSAFYYNQSITKRMPAYTLSKPTSTRAMQYAIFKEAAYTRTTPEYEPIQYGVFTKTNANIVVAPVAPKSPAAFGGGSVQYWPSWIGIASWMR